jgi:hypothetical protein
MPTTNPIEQLAWIVTILGFPGLIVSLILASGLDRRISDQLKELIRIAQSQNAIALNTMVFNDPINAGIIGAIESDEPILKEHKGNFLTFQLEKYLGDFETVASIYHEGLLTDEQLEQHFSHYIEQLSRNHEVTEYLESNPEYFDGLRTLFKLQPRIDGELQAT